jgi:hypothetical protein
MTSGATQITTRNLTFVAGEDLTDKLYYAVTLNSDGQVVIPTAANSMIIGFIQNKASAGESVLITIGETSKAIAGDDIAVGDLLIVDNAGKVVPCPTDAGTYNIIGIALDAGEDDSVIEVLIRPMILYIPPEEEEEK